MRAETKHSYSLARPSAAREPAAARRHLALLLEGGGGLHNARFQDAYRAFASRVRIFSRPSARRHLALLLEGGGGLDGVLLGVEQVVEHVDLPRPGIRERFPSYTVGIYSRMEYTEYRIYSRPAR